jgi:ABC-type branched-subunit amino acid transport system substrate-binding protein
MAKIIRFLLLIVITKESVLTQGYSFFNPVADSLFKAGVELFKFGLNSRGHLADTSGGREYFLNAYLKFDSVIALGLNHRTTASYLMASKSLCYLNRFAEAGDLLRHFLSKFPESEYVEDAHYTLGLIYFKLGDLDDALLEIDKSIQVSKSDPTKYKKVISALVDSVDLTTLQKLADKVLSTEVKYLIVVKVADKIALSGRYEDAKRFIADRLRYFRGTEFYERLMFKISYYERLLVRPEVKIGVLLPERQSLSESILKGIELAVEQHNLNFSPKVGIELRYYNSFDIDRKVLSFKKVPEVSAIIGPVYSEDVQICARFINDLKIPLISPTATSDGLADLSDYIFQLNSDLTTRARAIAQFAVFSLGLKYFFVLAPNDKKIKPFVDAFVDEVKLGSAQVMKIRFYNPDETDLRSYFREMKAVLDSSKVPLDMVGLFAPILNSDFIGIITSQVFYHDMNVKILGNDIWNNFNELYLNRRYADGVIFTAGWKIDLESQEYKNFVKFFKDRYGIEPDEFAIYGYDTARFILEVIKSGMLTPGEVYNAIKKAEFFGIGRDIVFENGRVNRSIAILVFKDNLIRRLTQWTIKK